jgi:cardiolipin synthase
MSAMPRHRKALLAIVIILALAFIIFLLGLLFISTPMNEKDIVIVGVGTGTSNGSGTSVGTSSLIAGSPAFLRTLSSITNAPIDHGENISIIANGDDFMNDLIAGINSASSSVNITLYPWSNGTFSDRVFAALTSAAKRNVTVRVLLDAVGGHTVPGSLITTLEKAGGQVAKYHSFSFLHPYQFDERDHTRSIVIDSETGFFGGMGIGDDWIESSSSMNGMKNSTEWKDMMFEVNGGMAESLENDFSELWNEATGEIIVEPAALSATRSLSAVSPAIAIPASAITSAPFISSTTAAYVHIISIPSSGGLEPIRDIFLLSIVTAQKSIYIVSPYIGPDCGIIDALESKARAGLDVRIVSPGDTTNAPLLREAWRADYGELLKAGVKLYEYEPSMDHEKYMLIDGVWSVTGSANMDSRSETLNAENVMGITDPTLASALTAFYMQDIAQSRQITLADWQRWSLFSKAWSHVLTIFSKQL